MRRNLTKEIPTLLLLTSLVFLVYLNSLGNAFVSDDKLIIESGKQIRNFSMTFSDPLTFLRPLVLWIIYAIFGPAPIYFRLVNIIFHVGNTFLVYLIVQKIHSTRAAIFTSLIFAVHPILSESIAWISGGSYAQYSFFFLLTLFLYITSSNNRKLYLISILTYLLALLSHTTAPVLSLILVVYEWLFGDIKKNWKKLIPFVLLSSFWLVNIIYFKVPKRISYLKDMYYVESSRDNIFFKDPFEIYHYFSLILWPKDLSLYPKEYYLLKQGDSYGPVLVLFYLILTTFSLRVGKQFFFWQSLFLISLIPTLTPLKLGAYTERYVYLGSVGIFATIGMLFTYLSKTKYKDFVYATFILIIISLSIRTIIRNMDWRNQVALAKATVNTNPTDPITHNNLGIAYFNEAKYKLSAEEFTVSLKLKRNNTDVLNNLGASYAAQGKCKQAIPLYEEALQIRPEMWRSYYNMSRCYVRMKMYDRAKKSINKAKIIEPDNVAIDAVVGEIYTQEGNFSEAKVILTKVLEKDPNNFIAKYYMTKITNEAN